MLPDVSRVGCHGPEHVEQRVRLLWSEAVDIRIASSAEKQCRAPSLGVHAHQRMPDTWCRPRITRLDDALTDVPAAVVRGVMLEAQTLQSPAQVGREPIPRSVR